MPDGESLHHTLGQLSWLSEQSCAGHNVTALTNSLDDVSGQTTDRVLMLARIKRALDIGGLHLYAQPIHNARGEGYFEILSRLESEGEIITPDRFIPLIAQFNLSHRFDLNVVEKLLMWMRSHPSERAGTRFSVNLMPLTLMQNEIAAEIIALLNATPLRRKISSLRSPRNRLSLTREAASTISSSCGITASALLLMTLVPAMPTLSA